MADSTHSAGFDEATHPRGQPDNAGKFRRRPLPEPPPARRPGKRAQDEAVAGTTSPPKEPRKARTTEDESRLLSRLSEHLSRLSVDSLEAHFALDRYAQRSEENGGGASDAEREALSAEVVARTEASTAAKARLREIDALPVGKRIDAVEGWVAELERCTTTPTTAEAAPRNAREVILRAVYGAEFVEGAEWRCVDCGDRTDLRVWHIVPAYRDMHPDGWSAKCFECALYAGEQDGDYIPRG